MALKISWSKKADQKFDKIIEYLENEWGDKVTRHLLKEHMSSLTC